MALDAADPPAAPELRWHYHRYQSGTVCSTPYFTQYLSDQGACKPGDSLTDTSPLMTHIWLIGDDPFVNGM